MSDPVDLDIDIDAAKRRIEELEQRERVLERASSLPAQQLAEVHIRNERRLAKRIAELDRLIDDHLLPALKRVMTLMDSGVLVRNISGDGSSDWPIKMLELVRDLNSIQTAIAKAESRS